FLLAPPRSSPLFPYTTLFRSVLLRELFAQTGVAVVVGVIELLLDRLQAFFQVAQALVQVFGAELPGLCQRAGQLVVGVLGREQRSEEHTSELQSRGHLVCRLL